ncbi:beta-glucosidase [Gordonia zhaorongruii]|uniref:beta-glucosidase n=1 Tax=Gordonia zhaorongruii TaxID=2597659 RepID=UPI00104486F9|nr:glycoside hydrolase family 3 C-terminal domain-containing protein [Gordonia zhaorongruii]
MSNQAGSPVDQLADALRLLVEKLSLEEKVRLLTGRDFWSTHPEERIGLRSLVFSDGPSGVRGPVWDERSPSLSLPSATALSSSWDPEIAERYGAVCAYEARRKGVDVVLGPTINLHRSPLGGRHFEAFSEDPVLTADLAAAYVHGVQRNGVGATPKHYVANDFETDRFTADVQVSERALRELYLLAFEKPVVDARAWLVMSAYNSVNGTTATENDLLESPLNDEWGFDGVVISDWLAVRSLESARHSQDVVMPGPSGPWGDALVEAVRSGEIPAAAVDRKVLRVLSLAARVDALDGFEPAAALGDVEDGVSFAREAEAEGMVLLRNDGLLPLGPDVGSIAVIGHHADDPRTQGGGSATVVPDHVVSPLDGIISAFPDAEVNYALGIAVREGLSDLEPERMRNPVTGDAGAAVRFLDADGNELYSENRFASSLIYFGGAAPVGEASTVEFRTVYSPPRTRSAHLGFTSVGTGRIHIDGDLRAELTSEPDGDDLGAALMASTASTTPVDLVVDQPIEIRIELTPRKSDGGLSNSLALSVGIEPDASDPEALLCEATEAARGADVAVVVVGTDSSVESEGSDRESLALPGGQDELVEAVLAANSRTIVLVNSGSPVLLPWRGKAAALVATYFGGQEYGNAIADVLTGVREPGGRLPTTWPATQEDVPVIDVTPRDGALRYDEGIHIGYRAWLKADRTPAYPFGTGLGYTTWELDAVTTADGAEGATDVQVTLRNTGSRTGKQVVQVYASRDDSAIDRPVRWLVGSTVVRADADAESTVEIAVPRRAFAHWDDGWQYETGTFTLHVGFSVDDLQESVDVTID